MKKANNNSKDKDNFYYEVAKYREESAKWFINRYSLLNAIYVIYNDKNITRKVIKLLFVAVPILVIVCILTHLLFPKINEEIILEYIYAILFIFILLALSLIIICSIINKNIHITFNLFLPRMQIAMASAWVLFITTEEFWWMGYRNSIFHDLNIFVFIILALLLIGFYLNIEFRNIHPDLKSLKFRNKFIRVTGIIALGFSSSFIIGLLFTSFIAENIVNASKVIEPICENITNLNNSEVSYGFRGDKTEDIIKAIICGKLTRVQLDSRYKENDVYERNKTSLFRYLQDIYYNDKEFFGYEKKSYLMYNLGKHIPFLRDRDLGIYYMPDYLILRSVLALFFGIFFQLIFQEKAITESF